MRKTRQKYLSRSLIHALLLLLPVCRGLAQPWYLPTEGADSVLLKNTSLLEQQAWLRGPGAQAEIPLLFNKQPGTYAKFRFSHARSASYFSSARANSKSRGP
jgi:hypothetical protein